MRKTIFVLLISIICIGCDNHHKTSTSFYSQNSRNESKNPKIQASDELFATYLSNLANVEIEAINDDYEESSFKYNYKNGDYNNYDISGYDEDGNYVSGNVDIDEYGDGYIEDEYGIEKYIEVKWVDWGLMEGYDEDGIYYEFNVE